MKYIFLFLFLPLWLPAQVTQYSISDSIGAKLDLLGYDSLPRTLDNVWLVRDGDTSVYSLTYQISGRAWMAISNTARPTWVRFGDNRTKKCYTFLELDNWLSGNCPSGYQGTTFASDLSATSATIIISGQAWIGEYRHSEGAGQTNRELQAMGRAFLKLLYDENFSSYLN